MFVFFPSFFACSSLILRYLYYSCFCFFSSIFTFCSSKNLAICYLLLLYSYFYFSISLFFASSFYSFIFKRACILSWSSFNFNELTARLFGLAGSFFSGGTREESTFTGPATLSIIYSIQRATYYAIALDFGVICLTASAKALERIVDLSLTGENNRGDLFLGIRVDIALYLWSLSGLIRATAFAFDFTCWLALSSITCILREAFEKI